MIRDRQGRRMGVGGLQSEEAGLAPSGGARRVRLHEGQRLPLEAGREHVVWAIESGCVLLDAPAAGGERQTLMLLFPGDEVSLACAPPLRGIGLTAAGDAVLAEVAETAAAGEVREAARAALARLAARSAMHAHALSRLSAEERVANLILELALRIGERTAGGCTLDLPLGRREMAGYLGLNPDTLSRIMARFKAERLIVTPYRDKVTIRDLARLAARTPLAEPLLRLLPDAPCGQSLAVADAASR